MDSKKKQLLFKILVIGDVGTGKTSIIRKYVHNMFSDSYKSTIGVDFALKVVHMDDWMVRMQLWDIAGQERFGQMTRVYYKDAVGAFVVFDVSRPDTFEGVLKWKADVARKVQLPDGTPVPSIMVGNKCDIEKEKWCKSVADIEQVAEEQGFDGWCLTSAKTGEGLSDQPGGAIHMLLSKIMKRMEESGSLQNSSAQSPASSSTGESSNLRFSQAPGGAPEKKKGCC